MLYQDLAVGDLLIFEAKDEQTVLLVLKIDNLTVKRESPRAIRLNVFDSKESAPCFIYCNTSWTFQKVEFRLFFDDLRRNRNSGTFLEHTRRSQAGVSAT